MDLGAGECKTAIELASDSQFQSHVWAITADHLKPPLPHHERLHILHGRLFEDIPDHELPLAGSVSCITDLFGAAFYSYRPTEVFTRAMKLLKDDGAFIACNGY